MRDRNERRWRKNRGKGAEEKRDRGEEAEGRDIEEETEGKREEERQREKIYRGRDRGREAEKRRRGEMNGRNIGGEKTLKIEEALSYPWRAGYFDQTTYVGK
jgi:hypothetical protein